MTRTPSSRTRRVAFTLVELVIVLVILAIVAALAVPTFAGLVESSREESAELTAEADGLFIAFDREKFAALLAARNEAENDGANGDGAQ